MADKILKCLIECWCDQYGMEVKDEAEDESNND